MKRTNYAGDTNEQQVGQEVVLKGWVAKRRNLGGLIFIDLWDREGIVQLVFNELQMRFVTNMFLRFKEKFNYGQKKKLIQI